MYCLFLENYFLSNNYAFLKILWFSLFLPHLAQSILVLPKLSLTLLSPARGFIWKFMTDHEVDVFCKKKNLWTWLKVHIEPHQRQTHNWITLSVLSRRYIEESDTLKSLVCGEKCFYFNLTAEQRQISHSR